MPRLHQLLQLLEWLVEILDRGHELGRLLRFGLMQSVELRHLDIVL